MAGEVDLMDTWSIAWLGWLGVFLILEGAAFIKTKHGAGTLSAKTWSWFGVKSNDWSLWTITRRVALLAFLVWLLSHLAFGWP